MTATPSPQNRQATGQRPTFVAALRDRLLRPGRDWVLVSVAMYALACVLPALPPIMGGDPIRGYVCLCFMACWFAPWWANPTYFVAVTASLLNRPRIAILFAIVAALLAVNYELIGFYEQGVSATLNELLPGCFMWIASLQLLACHELWRQWLDWQRRIYEREVGSVSHSANLNSSTRDSSRAH